MTRLFWYSLALLASALCSGAQDLKTRVLLDTDCFNEIDDQFFVTYSLLEPSFEIEGITAAQYRWERGSVDEAYFEILRVIDLMGIEARFPIVRGADGPIPDARSGVRSAATDLIRRAALRDRTRPLYILAVGALTNVASALMLHPEIRPLVRVIWLGGFPADGNMREFNAGNDRNAVKVVFESGVDLTVVPTETSARLLTLPYAEAEGRLHDSSRIAKALLSLLRDYGDRNKIIWDISTTACLLQIVRNSKFFEISSELAPRVDADAGKYIHRQGPHKIKVCGAPNRAAVFADFFERLPKPKDTDPPSLLFAASVGDPSTLDLAFSEPLDRNSAVRPECYTVSGGAVGSAVLTSDRAVRLKVSPPLTADRQLRVRVSCVADRAGNKVLEEWSEAAVRIESSGAAGLAFTAYAAESGLTSMPLPAGSVVYRGVIGSIALPGAAMPDAVARPRAGLLIVAEGFLNIPFDHRYEFDLTGRKFARVYLDGQLFLDQSEEGDRRSTRTRVVKAGPHRIRLEHYSDRSAPSVSLYWNLPFHDKSLVSDSFYFHR
jgi:purine nucleosidase